MDQRYEFALRALSSNVSMTELCREYGISRATGYKWMHRFHERGWSGMSDLSRRPRSSPAALSEQVTCAIIALKVAHPHWGPRKIRALYARSHPGKPVPSESSFKRVLSAAGFVEKRRRRPRRETGRLQQRREPTAPNDLWTVDFKGWWPAKDGQRCQPLTVRDAYSRFVLLAKPLERGDTETVRGEFEKLFGRYGLPRAIRSDNGSPFASRNAPLGLSRLSAWWLSLGIALDRTDPGRPDQNGAHERLHRDISQEIEGHIKGGLAEQEAALLVWGEEYNNERPHEALGMRVPADLYRPSSVAYGGTPDELEYPRRYAVRKVSSSGTIKIRNLSMPITTALRGWTVGLETLGPDRFSVWFGNLVLGDLDLKTECFAPARAGAEHPTLDNKPKTKVDRVSTMS